MDLREWCSKKADRSQNKVAAAIGMHKSVMSKIMNRKRSIDAFEVWRIYEFTKGKVTYEDWLKHYGLKD